MRALELLLAAAHRRQRAGARVLVLGQRGVQRSACRGGGRPRALVLTGLAAHRFGRSSRRDRARRAPVAVGLASSSSSAVASSAALRRAAARLFLGAAARLASACGALPPRPGGARIPRARAAALLFLGAALGLVDRRGWRSSASRTFEPSSARAARLHLARSTVRSAPCPRASRRGCGGGGACGRLRCTAAGARRDGGGFGVNSATAAAPASGLLAGQARTCASWSRRRRTWCGRARNSAAPCPARCRGASASSVFFGVDAQRLVVTDLRIAHSISSAASSASATAATSPIIRVPPR